MISSMRCTGCSLGALLVLGALALDFACTGHDTPGTEATPADAPRALVEQSAAPVDRGPELVRLEMRDRVVIIYGEGSTTPRTFTVTSASGKVLARDLVGDELARTMPDLFREVESMMATPVHADLALDARVEDPLDAL